MVEGALAFVYLPPKKIVDFIQEFMVLTTLSQKSASAYRNLNIYQCSPVIGHELLKVAQKCHF